MNSYLYSRFKGVIFDLDGVIMDSEPMHKDVYNQLFASCQTPLNWDEYGTMIGRSDVKNAAYIKRRFNLKTSEEQIVKLYQTALNKRIERGELEVVPYVEMLVKQLYKEGLTLGVASSSSRTNINKSLEIAGIASYISAVASADDVASGKPEPDVYIAALKQIGIKPRHCAAIEDTAVGVAAAKAAGMYAIGFTNTYAVPQDFSKADLVVQSLEDLLNNDTRPGEINKASVKNDFDLMA